MASIDMDDYDAEMRNVFHVVPPSQRKEVQRVILNKSILSSTSLQMFLYYNLFYSLAYGVFFCLVFRWKYLSHNGLRVNYFTPIFFSIWTISEIMRIYVGYQGNLKEDTPNMAAFLFLTVFPQMIITIYMLSMQVPLYGFDRIFSGIMLAFLIVELIIAWRCLGRFIADKTARFSVEYGGVESAEPDRSEVVALNRFIEDEPEEVMSEADELAESRPSARRARTALAASSTRDSSDIQMSRLIAPSRDGTMRSSFGGTGVLPIALTQSAPRSAPRGSGAPPADTLSSSLGRLTSSLGRSTNETPAEKAARRARDRAIITGQLVPERRTNLELQEELELELERSRMQAEVNEQNRLATSRPAMATLSSPAAVRIPRTDLASSPGLKRE